MTCQKFGLIGDVHTLTFGWDDDHYPLPRQHLCEIRVDVALGQSDFISNTTRTLRSSTRYFEYVCEGLNSFFAGVCRIHGVLLCIAGAELALYQQDRCTIDSTTRTEQRSQNSPLVSHILKTAALPMSPPEEQNRAIRLGADFTAETTKNIAKIWQLGEIFVHRRRLAQQRRQNDSAF